ncbi:hypothetical protein Q73A0000_01250 [Kaistella flava (ex Peng et al. 2021)]|uniref:Lipoprotein n=1 Tax=Kaistella flava (ex Peng et al. 2021) TaxID=2038776 RepID=A0A7M2Y5E1_9FLAO|nr:hypothetical protein [Kaistella flava (ex Peng et al. 2021)]QOW09069.1 hypothetical protein Q73A0000_01250 [Kaistella flava (ex Peng et al. 2021)]
MKKIYFLLMIPFLMGSCNSRYSVVPLNKFNKERKQIAQDFVETYLKKCENKDYSEFEGFNIAKKFQAKLSPDSLKRSCNYIYYKNGKVTVEKLVSAHTTKSPKDFMDVLNFKIKTEKSAAPMYLHLGMYRDQNYIEMPFYISADESYYETIRKKYYKK